MIKNRLTTNRDKKHIFDWELPLLPKKILGKGFEDMWMAFQCMKKVTLVREVPTQLRWVTTKYAGEWLRTNTMTNPNVDEDVEQLKRKYCQKEYKRYNLLEKMFCNFFKNQACHSQQSHS